MIRDHIIHEFVYIHKYIAYKNMKKFRSHIFLNLNHYTLHTVNGRKHAIKNLTITKIQVYVQK